jgi:hypothetical protein
MLTVGLENVELRVQKIPIMLQERLGRYCIVGEPSLMQRNRDCSLCTIRGPWRHRFLIQLHGHLTETNAADIRCIIRKGIESWFLIADTNDPDSIETVVQIACFQVLKGYIPNDWTSKQEAFYRRQHEKVLHRRAVDERTYRVLLYAQ